MAYTFLGGVRLNENKHTATCPITPIAPPNMVALSMQQHIGAPCVPVVQVGDRVDVGQCIGMPPSGALGCPIHASVSGTVTKIENQLIPSGQAVPCVYIENDLENRISPTVVPHTTSLLETSSDEMIEIVRQAGIVGMGGASFPTYEKIRSAVGRVDTLIVNVAECEPYLTADHRLCLERGENVVNGVKILMRAVDVDCAVFAVEDNKPDVIAHLEQLCESLPYISVATLKTKYPQGDERQLIYALKKTELPMGKLPADAGCVIFNAGTCAAVFDVFATGMPLVRRVLTCDGEAVEHPKNLLVPIGTPYRDIIAFCGGIRIPPQPDAQKDDKTPSLALELIDGGPMMGTAQYSDAYGIKKSTGGVLVRYHNKKSEPANICIRCGKCVAHCPMHLMPNELAASVKNNDLETAKHFDISSCVECGTCSYVCPGQVPIVTLIKKAKEQLRQQKTRNDKKENHGQPLHAQTPPTEGTAEKEEKQSDANTTAQGGAAK